MINRAALIVRPKQPFLDWAAGLGSSLELPELEAEQTVYLIPVCESEEQAEAILDAVHIEVFERELWSWHADESTWPRTRDLETFREWFDIELHGVVEDLCEYELVDEDVD
jgi:hypothetical protein